MRENNHNARVTQKKREIKIVKLDDIINKKDNNNASIRNKAEIESTRPIYMSQEMFAHLNKVSRRITENNGNMVNMVNKNQSKYAQTQTPTTMDNTWQTMYMMEFDIDFSPFGISYNSSLFNPKQFVWPENVKPEDHVKRFRRQIFTIADFNQIGAANVGTGGLIFGGPAVLGPSIGFSIYNRNLGIFPIVNPASAPGPAPTPMIILNPGATQIP